jgi:predicted flap endonuclease-1-like 5' DNA nuclease
MSVSQEAISIPVAYIETFVMTLVAFLIGYIGSHLYSKIVLKKKLATQSDTIKNLKETIDNLQDELDRKADGVFRKDRMDEEFDHLKVRNRAFSQEVISEKLVEKDYTDLINFERIGKATVSDKNELQQIIGIGPYTEAKLNELGIYTFDQISRLTKEDIEIITKLIKFFPDRIKNDRWVAKAIRLKEQLLEDAQDPKKKMKHKKTTY